MICFLFMEVQVATNYLCVLIKCEIWIVGRVRNIYFPFDTEADTALSVVTEKLGSMNNLKSGPVIDSMTNKQ